MLKRHGLKKGLSLVLVFCLILSLMPVALAQEPTATAGTGTTVGVTEGETTTPPTEGGGETTTPPTEGETTPPTEGETTPPTEGETTPPTEGETTPPTEGETTPPTDGETTPPTDGETTPPTEGETTPPTEGETTPPTDGETTPPTEGDTGMTDEPGTVEEPPITAQDIPHMQTKPADGESAYQPFDAGVGESDHFRIPALVTTKSGRLVAAADARWDGTGDGYGLDTIVAYSTPKYSGDVWKYTYANYLGDNGNKINSSSTAFIDPALAVAGNTIYMLVDLFPGGVMISNTQKGTGFDAQGHLLLKKSGESSYDYYVGEFVDGYASIYAADGNVVDGYEVDEYYNLYSKDGVSNVFFADAAFQVFPTSYLYLTTSTDGGKEWSAPKLLNADVKHDGEAFYGVGPGRGLVAKDGTIMFPCYSYGDWGQFGQKSSFIYSADGGETWSRTDDVPDAPGMINKWSSENQLVELSDGTIRCFFRNGTGNICYADYNGTWSSSVSTGISVESNCQISAITYSETINGQQAILLSCPSGSGRANGKIYVMLVGEGNTMTELTAFSVNSGYFGYSCLTELQDGRIAILYEGSEDFVDLTFARYAIEDVVGADAQIGNNKKVTDEASGVSVVAPDLVSVTVQKDQKVEKLEGTNRPYVAYDFTLTAEGGVAYTDAARVYIPAEELPWNLEDPKGFVVNEDGSIKEVSGYFTEDGAYFVFEMPHFSVGGVVGDEVELSQSYLNQESIDLTVGEAKEIVLPGYTSEDLVETELNSSIATVETTAPQTNGEIMLLPSPETVVTVTGVSEGSTWFAVGEPKTGTLYQINVAPKPEVQEVDYLLAGSRQVTKLTTSIGTSYTLSVPSVDGVASVVWSSADEGVVTVSNGEIKGVKAGATTVTATVKDSAGNTLMVATIPVTVLNYQKPSGAWDDPIRTIDTYISEVKDTQAYYSLNCATEVTPVQEGELIYVQHRKRDNLTLDFFAAPENGYALTRMVATGSNGEYFTISGSDAANTDFYNAGVCNTHRKYFDPSQIQSMIQKAMDIGCDGALGFNRDGGWVSQGDLSSTLSFYSEKLPTVTKEVISVNGVSYTPGMIAHEGEEVRFKITVTQYAGQDAIQYPNVMLKDMLSGAVFVENNADTVIPPLSNEKLDANKNFEYLVTYTVKFEDLDKTITNTAQLSYTYKSEYSSGTFSGAAEAEAKISAVTFEPKSIVVDFGLPVVLNFNGQDQHGKYDLASGNSALGNDVKVENNVVTYTPKEVFTDKDTVTLYNTEGTPYQFDVYPATTVYYEEGFATAVEGFDGGNASKGSGSQAWSIPGSKDDHHYGYDTKYGNENSGPSNGTAMTSDTAGDTAIFAFTGTGVEIYANCTPTSGTVMIQVYKQGNDKPIKTLLVDTAMKAGYSNATDFQEVDGYNVPIASLLDLSNSPEDYTVEITNVKKDNKTSAGTVSLDGFRVHGTLGTSETVYAQDGEDDPAFVQLRDAVLADVDTTGSQYAKQIAANAMSQVYATGHDKDTVTAVVFDGNNNSLDLLDFGPKNELYLKKDQTVTFTLTQKAQIGLKALNKQVSYEINSEDKTLNSSTDMFTTTYNAGSVTITNNGDGILAITQIKAVSGISASAAKENVLVLQPLTADDLVPALVAMGCKLSDEDF